MMSWLNPKNWVKSGIISAANDKVDEYVTLAKGKELVNEAVNAGIALSDAKVTDERLRSVADGLKLSGEALTKLGEAIHPDGEDGRKVSTAEMEKLLAVAERGFGMVFDEQIMANLRDDLKEFITKKIQSL